MTHSSLNRLAYPPETSFTRDPLLPAANPVAEATGKIQLKGITEGCRRLPPFTIGYQPSAIEYVMAVIWIGDASVPDVSQE